MNSMKKKPVTNNIQNPKNNSDNSTYNNLGWTVLIGENNQENAKRGMGCLALVETPLQD